MKPLAVCAAALMLASAVCNETTAPEPIVHHPHQVLYRTDRNGFPVVSDAGFVQLRAHGPGFFYTGTLAEVRPRALRMGSYDRDNWGDPEAFVRLGRLVRGWLEDHPRGPRIGIYEISSEFGGFGDFDGDGRSDHLTHQSGFNFNISMISKAGPEVYIALGRTNDARYSPDLMRDLAHRLLLLGVPMMTVNRRALLLETTPGSRQLEGTWAIHQKTVEGAMWKNQEGAMILVYDDAHGHRDHINVQLSPIP